MRNAVVAAEDPSFFGDSSTIISRQYARAATGLDSTPPPVRRACWSCPGSSRTRTAKRQILEFYLNTVYFGRGAYGIEAAAQAYFAKSSGT